MPNVELEPLTELSAFRRLALGTWQTAYDPTIYGSIELRMDQSLAYIEAFRQRTGRRITVTTLVAKALAMALSRCPEANAILRYNRIYLRKSVDLSILVVQTDEGAKKVDLAACKINGVDKKSLYALASEVDEQVKRVRERRDAAMEQGKKTTRAVPLWLMNIFLKILSFFMYTLNLDLFFAGIPKDPFGGATITNLGSLGLDTGFVPLVPYTRVPIFVAPGAIRSAPVVEDGAIVVGKIMKLCATLDHRLIDGYHAKQLSETLRSYLEDPFNHFDPIESLPEAVTTRAEVEPSR
jgi:pyruvate dehydrogenase E2 component (dihydrolipoamide acetyltransferase)